MSGRAFMCRRGPASRCVLVDGAKVLNKDTRPGFPVGQCVRHKAHGIGKIIGEGTSPMGRAITVAFDQKASGIKTFIVELLNGNLAPEDA